MPHDVTQPPFIDELSRAIAASVDDVWDATLETLDRALSRPRSVRYTRLVGCADTVAAGPRPLTVGSTLPGFRVIEAVPPSSLVLAGSHHFTTGVLTFRLEPHGPDCTHLTAETRAAFPGRAGRAYRLLVIGSRGHVLVVRRLLAAIDRSSTRYR